MSHDYDSYKNVGSKISIKNEKKTIPHSYF